MSNPRPCRRMLRLRSDMTSARLVCTGSRHDMIRDLICIDRKDLCFGPLVNAPPKEGGPLWVSKITFCLKVVDRPSKCFFHVFSFQSQPQSLQLLPARWFVS